MRAFCLSAIACLVWAVGLFIVLPARGNLMDSLDIFQHAFSAQHPASPAPRWIAGHNEIGGAIDEQAGAWVVAAGQPAGHGQFLIHLNRSELNADLALTLGYGDEPDTHFIVQLQDEQGRIVSLDLFSNIRTTAERAWTDTFIIPLARYPDATTIAIRRFTGALRLYGVVLYPVQSEIVMTLDDEDALARWLGDTLHPNHPLMQTVQVITPPDRGAQHVDMNTARPLTFLERSNPLGHQALKAPEYPRYEPTRDNLTGTFVPAHSGTSTAFLMPILQNLKAYHPNADWGSQRLYYASTGVLWLMQEDRAALGISSWPMSSAQRETFHRRFGYPVLEARVALDAVQMLVHKDNPLEQITIPQLDALYGTEQRAGYAEPIRLWPELGVTAWGPDAAIRAFAVTLHYGTANYFQEAVLKGGPWRSDLDIVVNVQHGTEWRIEQEPWGIGISNHLPRGDGVRVVPVARQSGEQAYLPLPRHIYEEQYPLTRFFYVYVNAPSAEDLSPEIREFLNYLLSYEGQHEIAKSGSLPLDARMVRLARQRLGL